MIIINTRDNGSKDGLSNTRGFYPHRYIILDLNEGLSRLFPVGTEIIVTAFDTDIIPDKGFVIKIVRTTKMMSNGKSMFLVTSIDKFLDDEFIIGDFSRSFQEYISFGGCTKIEGQLVTGFKSVGEYNMFTYDQALSLLTDDLYRLPDPSFIRNNDLTGHIESLNDIWIKNKYVTHVKNGRISLLPFSEDTNTFHKVRLVANVALLGIDYYENLF